MSMVEVTTVRMAPQQARRVVRRSTRQERLAAREVIRETAAELGIRRLELARRLCSQDSAIASEAWDAVYVNVIVGGWDEIDWEKLLELIFAIIELLMMFA